MIKLFEIIEFGFSKFQPESNPMQCDTIFHENCLRHSPDIRCYYYYEKNGIHVHTNLHHFCAPCADRYKKFIIGVRE